MGGAQEIQRLSDKFMLYGFWSTVRTLHTTRYLSAITRGNSQRKEWSYRSLLTLSHFFPILLAWFKHRFLLKTIFSGRRKHRIKLSFSSRWGWIGSSFYIDSTSIFIPNLLSGRLEERYWFMLRKTVWALKWNLLYLLSHIYSLQIITLSKYRIHKEHKISAGQLVSWLILVS